MLISIALGALAGLVALALYYNKGYTIEIVASPEDAEIRVDNKPAPSPLVLKRGSHTLVAEKAGFKSEERIFTVPEDLVLSIILEPEPEYTHNTKPFMTHSLAETKRGLVGVDKETGSLVLYGDGGEQIIYQGSVRSWSYNHPWIAILDSNRRTKYVIMNIDSGDTLEVASPTDENVEWASVDASGEVSYVLTSIDPAKRTTDLYVRGRKSQKSTFLTRSNATQVESLQGGVVLLIAGADGEFASRCSIFNPNDRSATTSWQANKCLINDARNLVLIESPEVKIYETLTNKEFDTKTVGGIAWSGDHPLVVRRTAVGVIVDIYNGTSLTKSSTLPIDNYRKVIGATESHITLQTVDGQIKSYALE